MDEILSDNLLQYKNIRTSISRGLTHTTIRVTGDSIKFRKSGFLADVIVNRRTQDISVARIDNKDKNVLYEIISVVSRFKF
jgi:hypothetical protein